MDAKESLKLAIRRFREMVSELNLFMSDSEDVFLRTGAKLQHLESEANRLLVESSDATRMGTSQDNPAEHLREGLARLDRRLEQGQADTERGMQSLTAVLGDIQSLSRLDRSFYQIVSTLQALASTTRLENSRWNAKHAGFDTVVNDLRAMAAQLRPKFGEVLSRGHDVKTTAQSALAQASTFLDRHRRDVTHLRKQTAGHLATMTDACNTSYVLANKSAEGVSGVRTAVEKVLQSLQVQDIVRQVIEHIVQNMGEFAESAGKVVDQEKTGDVFRSWLAELAVVSRVEAAQLDSVCDRFLASLTEVDSSLRSIVSTLAGVATASSTFSGKGRSISALQHLERGIRATTQTLREHDTQEASMMRALDEVTETVSGVEALVDEVARLGRDARFIGLNAMVKAVRVGQAGLTLTVLSREIQDVSDEIETLTSSAATIIRTVSQEAYQMAGAAGKGEDASARSGDEVASGLEDLVRGLGAYQSSLGQAVELLVAGSATLRSDVTAIGQSLRGLTEEVARLRQISRELLKIHATALEEAQGAEPPADRRAAENHRYTMEKERRIQHGALSLGASVVTAESRKPADEESAEGTIEFF